MSSSGDHLLRMQHEISHRVKPAKAPIDFTRRLFQIEDKRAGQHRPDRIKKIYQETIELLNGIERNKVYLSENTKRQLEQFISNICNDMIAHRHQAIKGYGSYFGSQIRDKGEELLHNDYNKIKIIYSHLDSITAR